MNIKTEDVKVTELKPAEYNPRSWSDKNVADLKESISKFGMVDPILVNSAPKRKGTVIGGHFRLHVAKLLGLKEVPVAWVNIPDVEREKELNLRLNKNTADWDWKMLGTFDPNLLDSVGFGNKEIDQLFSQNAPEDDFSDEEGQAEDKAAKAPPKAKSGDLYELGGSRLMCGDSTSQEDVKRLMGGVLAKCVFTDPPYNVNYEGKTHGKIKNDNMGEEAFIKFSEDFIARMSEACAPGATFYICSGYSSFPTFLYALRTNGFEFSTPIVWVKNNTSFGWGDYHKQHEMVIKTKNPTKKKRAEPILYGWKKGRHFFVESSFEADVWQIPRRGANTMIHPTQKPLEIVRRAIANSTKRNDVVLDLFGGSGSTLIACQQAERKAYLMELDPIYVDKIIRRWEHLTKQKAKKVENKQAK